jgi:hypothetical protein
MTTIASVDAPIVDYRTVYPIRKTEIEYGDTVGSDLKVDYQLLESVSNTMTGLTNELQNMESGYSGYDWALGSGDVAGAMGSFAGNWAYHRGQILNNMGNLNNMVQEAAKEFKKTDSTLSSALTKK